MTVIELNTGSTPALLIGEKSEKVFLFVHGLHGNKEEALAFAEVAVPKIFFRYYYYVNSSTGEKSGVILAETTWTAGA